MSLENLKPLNWMVVSDRHIFMETIEYCSFKRSIIYLQGTMSEKLFSRAPETIKIQAASILVEIDAWESKF